METYINPHQTYFERPQELTDLVSTTKLVQKYLPRQADIEKILDVIKKKVMKGTHLPLTIKEIQAGYLISLHLNRYMQVFGPKHLTKKKACEAKGRKPIRQMCRFMHRFYTESENVYGFIHGPIHGILRKYFSVFS